MTSKHLKIFCYCGEAAFASDIEENEDVIDSPLERTKSCVLFCCGYGKCPLFLEVKTVEDVYWVPGIRTYRYRHRNVDGENETGEIKSYREDMEKVWLEYKKKIPKITLNDLLKENLPYLMPYKSCYCRAVANSIARSNSEVALVKQLMGVEAFHIIMCCKKILTVTGEKMKLLDAVEKYYDESQMLIDENEVERVWLKVVDEASLSGVTILNILSDELRKSEIWNYCIRDIAKGIISYNPSFCKMR